MAEEKRETVQTISWNPRYRDDFARLNVAWIEKYFVLEDIDRRYLYQPEEKIVDPGGDVILLVEDGRCIGTCALIKAGDDVFELAKMSVEEHRRGRGLGNLLMQATLDRARELGAARVFLLSNTRMEAALSLYRKFGFRTVRLGPHPDYERCDIEMAIDL